MDGMTTIGERIRKAREAKKLSQTDLANRLKLTRNAISLWESNKSEPKPKTMRQVAAILGKDHDWLTTGRTGNTARVLGLCLIGDVAAGVWYEIPENQDMEYERVPIAPDPRYPPDSQYALKIRGNSVNRIAKDGTIVHCVDIADAGIDVRDGDLVWVERHRGGLVEATIKRIRKTNGTVELWPESDDPLHQEKLTLKGPKGDTEAILKGLVLFTLNPVPRGS